MRKKGSDVKFMSYFNRDLSSNAISFLPNNVFVNLTNLVQL